MDDLAWLLENPFSGLPPAYIAYRNGEYVPSEERPLIRVKGRRRWYAPWLRYPDEIRPGMSEAMAFRAQDAQLQAGIECRRL